MTPRDDDIGEQGDVTPVVRPVDPKRETTGVFHVEKISRTGKPLGGGNFSVRKIKIQAVVVAGTTGLMSAVGGFIGEWLKTPEPVTVKAPAPAIEPAIARMEDSQRRHEAELRVLHEQNNEVLKRLRKLRRGGER